MRGESEAKAMRRRSESDAKAKQKQGESEAKAKQKRRKSDAKARQRRGEAKARQNVPKCGQQADAVRAGGLTRLKGGDHIGSPPYSRSSSGGDVEWLKPYGAHRAVM